MFYYLFSLLLFMTRWMIALKLNVESVRRLMGRVLQCAVRLSEQRAQPSPCSAEVSHQLMDIRHVERGPSREARGAG